MLLLFNALDALLASCFLVLLVVTQVLSPTLMEMEAVAPALRPSRAALLVKSMVRTSNVWLVLLISNFLGRCAVALELAFSLMDLELVKAVLLLFPAASPAPTTPTNKKLLVLNVMSPANTSCLLAPAATPTRASSLLSPGAPAAAQSFLAALLAPTTSTLTRQPAPTAKPKTAIIVQATSAVTLTLISSLTTPIAARLALLLFLVALLVMFLWAKPSVLFVTIQVDIN